MPITTEITVKPQAFASAVAWAAKWVATKPIEPVQAGLALSLTGDGALAISAYSENVTARAMVACGADDFLSVNGTQRAIVSGRLLAQLAATFSSNKPVVISGGEDGAVLLRAGSFRATLPTLDEDDWQTLPDAAPAIGAVGGAALATAAGRVCPASHTDVSSGLTLSCASLEFDSTVVRIVAASRQRAAGVTLPWSAAAGFTGGSATPLASVLEDAAAAFNGPDDVTIGLSPSLLSFTSPTRSMTVALMDLDKGYPTEQVGGYLGFEQTSFITIDPHDLAVPIKQASIVRGKEGAVRVTVAEGALTISAAEGQLKQQSDGVIEVDYDGEPCVFGVNPDYLSAALTTAPDGPVVLGFGIPSRMITLASAKDPDWHHVVMPVRIDR